MCFRSSREAVIFVSNSESRILECKRVYMDTPGYMTIDGEKEKGRYPIHIRFSRWLLSGREREHIDALFSENKLGARIGKIARSEASFTSMRVYRF